MANDHQDPFETQINQLQHKFKQDILSGIKKQRWPDRIDYVATKLAVENRYVVGIDSSSGSEQISSGRQLDKAASDHYLDGIVALTDDYRRRSTLPDDFRLGQLLVEFSKLRHGLDKTETEIPPGEVLGRLITRNIKRNSAGGEAQAAHELHTESSTPRELVSELTAVPELADSVEGALPDKYGDQTLAEQLAEVNLTTQLWAHQLEALSEWLRNDMHGYVDMATATGKTVLGLAAVAHMVDAGSLHPHDEERLQEILEGNIPEPDRDRPDDVLIVTTDDLLGVQWARLFREHCHTPPEYTRVENNSIKLPWGTIDIRAASAVTELNPSDYRLAIFDEVHNYSSESGWGDILTNFIESPCPVLALTGSVTEEFEFRVKHADQEFPRLGEPYTHKKALRDGIIPDFSWTLTFTRVQEDSNLEELKDGAQTIPDIVDYRSDFLNVSESTLEEKQSKLDLEQRQKISGTYETGSELANQLRDVGEGPEGPTDLLEKVANGLSNRTIHRLNLSTETTIALDLAQKALSEGSPVLILTRSYEEAKELWQELYDRHSDRKIVKLKRDQTPKQQDKRIQDFDEAETEKKALIAPGKRIGQGKDIQSVEVGINIAQPGSGANTTLVQRLGRLLRKSGGKESVEFYHVLGVQPSDTVLPPDGESFITNVVSFFGEAIAPDTDGMLKPPSVSIESDNVAHSVATLEQTGVYRVAASEQSSQLEDVYADRIRSTGDESTEPVIKTDWFEEAFDLEVTDHAKETEEDQNKIIKDSRTKKENRDTNVDESGVDKRMEETEIERGEDQQKISPIEQESESGSENKDGRSVTIDPTLVALIDATVKNPDTSHETRGEVVTEVVRSFLKNIIAKDVGPDKFTTDSKRQIEFSSDPTLERFLEERLTNKSFPDSIDELVKEAIYSYTGIDTDEETLHVKQFSEFQLPIEAVIEDEQYPCETPDEVIQVALEDYFEI